MKTALEEELGTTLAAHASTLPPGVAARVRAIDYHPRQRRRALPIGLAAGAAGAATVGTVLAVALGGAAPAYAGWSATPTSPTSSVTPNPSCIGTLTSAPGGSSGTWQTVLSDVRGPFTITLLQNATSYASCFTGPSFSEVNRITTPSSGSSSGTSSGSLSVNSQSATGATPGQGAVGSQITLEGTSSGDLTQVLQNHLTTSSDGPYTFIDGRVTNGVTAVALVLKDGQSVVSTVDDGWFVAWWPGSEDAATAQVTKGSATTSEPLVPVSSTGTKFPLGQPGSPSSKSSGSSGNSASGNSGSGNSGSGNTGITGPGPTTKSKP